MATFELKGKYTDGTDWTAGTFNVPTSLPNHMSLEKPTSISINESGNERTITGVAEFESNGAMESGEFHSVDETPLIFLVVGSNTNVVVGGTALFVNSMFNRVPHVNEQCYFVTTQPDSSKVAWTGRCIEVSGDTSRFQVAMTVNLGGGAKKYLHRIIMETDGAFHVSFQLVSTQSRAYTYSSMMASGLVNDLSIPASGAAIIQTQFRHVVYVTNPIPLGKLQILTFSGAPSSYSVEADPANFIDSVVEL